MRNEISAVTNQDRAAPFVDSLFVPGNERPKRYSVPLRLLAAMTPDILRDRPRSLLADARALLASLAIPPVVDGVEHIPVRGGCAIIYNHYQRPGLWIGFAGAMLIDAAARVRGDAAYPLRMMVTDRALVAFLGRKVEFPGSRFFLGRVAHIYGMVTISSGRGDTAQRGAALKRALALVKSGQAIAIAPEGAVRGDFGLREARWGSGPFLRLVSSAGGPIVPAAVWEDAERLYARIGVPFRLQSEDEVAARTEAMKRIAELLPASLRGIYG